MLISQLRPKHMTSRHGGAVQAEAGGVGSGPRGAPLPNATYADPATMATALLDSWRFLEPSASGVVRDPGMVTMKQCHSSNPFDYAALATTLPCSDVLLDILSAFFRIDKLTVLTVLLAAISDLVVADAETISPVWLFECPANITPAQLKAGDAPDSDAGEAAVPSDLRSKGAQNVSPLRVMIAQPGGGTQPHGLVQTLGRVVRGIQARHHQSHLASAAISLGRSAHRPVPLAPGSGLPVGTAASTCDGGEGAEARDHGKAVT